MKTPRYLFPSDYMADPSANVFGDRLYIFPSHDRDSGEAFEIRMTAEEIAAMPKLFADAARRDILPRNPIALVKRPSKGQFTADPYTPEEIKQLFTVIEGDPLELLIKLL